MEHWKIFREVITIARDYFEYPAILEGYIDKKDFNPFHQFICDCNPFGEIFWKRYVEDGSAREILLRHKFAECFVKYINEHEVYPSVHISLIETVKNKGYTKNWLLQELVIKKDAKEMLNYLCRIITT